MIRVAHALAVASAALCACQLVPSGLDEGSFASTGEVSPGPGESALASAIATDSSGEGSTDGTEDGAESDAMIRFDVPAFDTPPAHAPCQSVDILFVVDNSGSMADEQLNLVGSFAGFIAGIEQLLGSTTSYHVGVVTTDENAFNAEGCRLVGALTTQTDGLASSHGVCGPYAGGGNFMTKDDDLDASFACAAQVGIDGAGIERPMDAVAAVLGGASDAMLACNSGFLRDDGLLVLVIITDEEDNGDSHGGPGAWFDAVVASRGEETNVVVLSLIGHPKPNECLPTQWTGMQGAEISPRLMAFTEAFTYGFVRDVCAPDYGPWFADAVAGVAQACHLPAG